MTKQFNGLTAAESERLYLLLEECGEVVQMVGKTLRHGYESTPPNGGPTNRSRLESELGDIYEVLRMMFEAKDLSEPKIKSYANIKRVAVRVYLHHQD